MLDVRYEVFMALKIKVKVSWVVMPCSIVLQCYAMSQPKRPWPEFKYGTVINIIQHNNLDWSMWHLWKKYISIIWLIFFSKVENNKMFIVNWYMKLVCWYVIKTSTSSIKTKKV